MRYCIFNSLVGKLLLAGDVEALQLVSFQDGTHPTPYDPSWVYDETAFRHAISQFEAYFVGELKNLYARVETQRNHVSTKRVAATAINPLWRNDLLWCNRPSHRQPESLACGGSSQREKSASHRGAVSSSHRQ